MLSALNVALGFLLPAVICLQYVFPLPVSIFKTEALADFGTVLAIAIAVIGIAIGVIYGNKIRAFATDFFRGETYTDYDNCFLLFLTIAAGVSIFVLFFASALEAGVGVHGAKIKATETVFYLIVLVIVAIILYRTRRDAMTISASGKLVATKNAKISQYRERISKVSEFAILVWNVGRIFVGFIAGLVVFLVAVSRGVDVGTALAHMLPITLATMAGFVLNDLFDLEKDKLSTRNKPLAIGLVSLSSAKAFALILVISSLVIAAAIAKGTSYYIVAATLAGVILYSIAAYRTPILKGFITASLCCAPFLYVSEISNASFPMSFYGYLLLFVFGRELLLDARDRTSDEAAGVRTLAAYMDPLLSRTVGWALMFGSVMFVVLNVHGLAQIFLISALVALGICLVLYLRSENLGLAWSRAPLLLGVIAVPFI